jgi:radical SAM superfamily enzyme YgiQ (UPF0313 family)
LTLSERIVSSSPASKKDRPRALLLLPPTDPPGSIPLSLAVVAAWLRPAFDVRIIDMNVAAESELSALIASDGPFVLCGLSVSAQTVDGAVGLTRRVRTAWPDTTIVWGGEFPTLLPDFCLLHADSVVLGRFEPVADALVSDVVAGSLRRTYGPLGWRPGSDIRVPALDLFEHADRYPSFPGLPLESSLGCRHGCSFCMVKTMQPVVAPYPISAVEADLDANPRRFVQVVDYDLGTNREHLLALASSLERSSLKGWTGEMCVATLDDDEVLAALARSRCRVIYCGLEVGDQLALRSVGKAHNNVNDYLRLIRKAQSYRIEVAGGFILGLAGTRPDTFRRFLRFAEEAGLVYLKLTWLTFNPGTRIHDAMRNRGVYLSDDAKRFDGNTATYLPEGVDLHVLEEGARALITSFYSAESELVRSKHLRCRPAERAEFQKYGRLFGNFYRSWLEVPQEQEEAKAEEG